MKSENKQFLRYIMLTVMMALLAFCLVLLFHIIYGGSGLGSLGYIIYGFALHVPVWTGLFLLADLVLKIRIPRIIIFALEGLLFSILMLPVIYKPSDEAHNYIEIGHHMVVFLLCLGLLIKLRLRFIETKGKLS